MQRKREEINFQMFERFNKFKKYKFTDKKRSKGGMISSLFLVISVALLVWGIYISYKSHGNGGIEVGILAMVSLIISLSGFFVGIKSFSEDNVFRGYSWIGTIGNTVLWVILACLMLVGL